MNSFLNGDDELVRSGGGRRFAFGAAVFFLLFVLLFSWPLVFGGRTLTGGDIINAYLPYKHLVREQMARGEFPHWNPLTFSGRPLQADIQVGVFYPPNVLFWTLPLDWAFNLSTMFHLWLGTWGMALWMRRHLKGAVGAILAGGLFMFGGFVTTRFVNGVVLFQNTMAWLPWLLFFWDRVAGSFREDSLPSGEGGAKWDFCALVAVSVHVILAGAPQMAYYCFGILGLYALVLEWRARDEEIQFDVFDEEASEGVGPLSPLRVRPFLVLACGVALAAGICAVQLLPTKELVDQSWGRSEGLAWEYAIDGSLEPRMLLTFGAPFFFSDPLDEKHYWSGRYGYWENSAYMSVLPFLLGGIFLAGRWGAFRGRWLSDLDAPKRRDAVRFEVFLLLLIGISLLLVFGKHSPFYWLAYHVVPGFDRFRGPARLLLLFVLGLSALSGWTLDRLGAGVFSENRSGGGREDRRALAPPLAVWLLGLAGGVVLWRATPAVMYYLKMPFYFMTSVPEEERWRFTAPLEMEARASVGSGILLWAVSGLFLLAAFAPFPRREAAAKSDGREGDGSRRAPRIRPYRLAALCLALAVCFADLFFYGRHFLTTESRDELRSRIYPSTPLVEFLKKELASGGRFLWFDSVLDWDLDQNQSEILNNRPIVQGLAQMRGYDPVNSRRYGLSMNQLTRLPLGLNPRSFMFVPDQAVDRTIDWRLAALWDCRIALSYKALEHPDIEKAAQWDFPGAKGEAKQTLRAYRLKNPSGPARLCRPFPVNHDTPPEEMARSLSHPDFDARRHALVKADPLNLLKSGAWEAPGAETLALEEKVELVEKRSASMVFDLTTPKPALLVLSLSYYPGWRARVDGRSMPVFPANLAQCSVPVPAGRHEVRFFYRPTPFLQGAVVSLASLFLLGLLLLRKREGA